MTPIQLAREFEAVTAQAVEPDADPFATVRATHPGHKYLLLIDKRSQPNEQVPAVIAAIPPGSRCFDYLNDQDTVEVLDNDSTEPPEFLHPQVLMIARWLPDMHPWWITRHPGAIYPD